MSILRGERRIGWCNRCGRSVITYSSRCPKHHTQLRLVPHKGAEVRILRTDIWEYRNWTRKRPRGRIMRINGGYIYVRPHRWPRNRPPLELYDNEIEVLP